MSIYVEPKIIVKLHVLCDVVDRRMGGCGWFISNTTTLQHNLEPRDGGWPGPTTTLSLMDGLHYY